MINNYPVLDEFRRKTKMLLKIPGHTAQAIETDLHKRLDDLLKRNSIDFELGEIVIYGSRSRHCHTPASDLNILAEILTDEDESTLADALNVEKVTIDGIIRVVIKPICIKKTDCISFYNHIDLETYLSSAEEYMRKTFSNDARGTSFNYENTSKMASELHFSRMISVTDNWCPCYPDNKVKLEIALFPPDYYEDDDPDDDPYVVQIWAHGADDLFVSLWQTYSDSASAEELFLHWKYYIYDRVPDGVNLEWFYEHGFTND